MWSSGRWAIGGNLSTNAAVENLIVDCTDDIDDDKLEAWPDYFRKNYQNHQAPLYQDLPLGVFYCEGKGMMMVRTALPFVEPAQHQETGEGYRGTHEFQCGPHTQDGGMEIYAVGKFLDAIAFENGKPLFQDRRVVFDPPCRYLARGAALVHSSGAFKTVFSLTIPPGRSTD